MQLPFPLLMSPGWRGLVLRQQHIIPINNMKPHAVAIAWAQIMKFSMYLLRLESFYVSGLQSCTPSFPFSLIVSKFQNRKVYSLVDMAENEGLWLPICKGKGRIGISPLAVKGIMPQQLEREREREICSAHGLSLKEAEITWASLWI